MEIKATKTQIRCIIEDVNLIDLKELLSLPIPKELIAFKKGDYTEKEIENIVSNYSIRKAHNIICVLNRKILKEV